MNKLMLEIQQYLALHPVVKMKSTSKAKYMNILKHFVSSTGCNDICITPMLQLYSSKIGNAANEKKLKDLNIFEKFKFFNYRYFLLTDCLFICAFDNSKKGKLVLKNIINFYGKRYRNKMQSVFEAFYGIGDQEIIRTVSQLEPIYKVIWKDRDFSERAEKRIMITANMSAGKSTLLNALFGKKINKMQNTTCTAKIHYIHNKAGEDGLICKWDYDLELDASHEKLMNDNNSNETTEIHVGTRFRSLSESDARVCFIDTPGVNSSMEIEHREMSNKTIKDSKCDLLLYLFNAENIGTDDDIRHLRYVKENYDGKIIFLVNRMDRFKKNVDFVSQTMASVEKDLLKLGFKNPTVYPISAYAAYLAKMSMYGEELSDDELDDLEFLRRKLSRADFAYETYYPNKIEIAKDKINEFNDVLIHSGILSLENIIFDLNGEKLL